ncbi:YqhG family protein [Paenibacillus sp. P26]|nr:YqhG family protein [Paenibacillus sp. P26]
MTMNAEQIRSFVMRYLEAEQCDILEKHPAYVTVKLSPSADRDLTNRPYYWNFVERTGAAPETMTCTFIFDPEQYSELNPSPPGGPVPGTGGPMAPGAAAGQVPPQGAGASAARRLPVLRRHRPAPATGGQYPGPLLRLRADDLYGPHPARRCDLRRPEAGTAVRGGPDQRPVRPLVRALCARTAAKLRHLAV